MSSHWFLDNEGDFLLNIERNLHFDWFHLCLVNLNFLVLDTVPVCLHWNLPDDFERHLFYDLNLHNFLYLHLYLHYLLHLNSLVLFFLDHNSLDDLDLDGNLNSLNFDLRYWDLYYLKLIDPLDNYLLHYLGNFHYLLYYPWNWHYFLNYFFNLDYPGHLHYLFNYSVDKLGLDLHDFFLDNYRNWSIDLHRLHNFLPGSDNLHSLNLKFFDSFRNERYLHFCGNSDFFPDVEGYNFLYFDIFGDHNFLDDGLVNVHLNFYDLFLFVPLDKVGSVNINLLGDLLDQLFLNLQLHFHHFFNCVGDHDRLVPVLSQFNDLNFRFLDLNWDLADYLNGIFISNEDRHSFLNLHQLCLVDDLRDSHLDFLNDLSCLNLWYNLLFDLGDLNDLLDLCLNDPLDLSDLNVSYYLVYLNLFDYFLSVVHCHHLLNLHSDLLRHFHYSLHYYLSCGRHFDQLLSLHLKRHLFSHFILHWLFYVDRHFLYCSVYLLLFLSENSRLCSLHRNSLLKTHCVIDLVLNDDRSLDVPGWRPEHLDDSIHLKIVALLLKHSNQSSIKGELYSMLASDAHELFKEFFEHGLQVEDHFHLLGVVICVDIVDSNLFDLVDHNLFETLNGSTFNKFNQQLRLEQLNDLA